MINKDKKQAKAFRLTEETFEKFKEISQEMGTNQQQTLARLIEAYESEIGKEKFPEMRENLDTFEGYIRSAANMYVQAIESVQNMRGLVRTEYDAQLKSKDKTIAELQERVDRSEKVAKEVSSKEIEYKALIEDLKREVNDLNVIINDERENFEKRINEAENRYKEIYNLHAKLQITESEMKKETSILLSENQDLKMKNIELLKEKQLLESKLQKIEWEKQSIEADYKKDKQTFEIERQNEETKFLDYKHRLVLEHKLELQTKVNELHKLHKAELDNLRKETENYKDLYLELMNKTVSNK